MISLCGCLRAAAEAKRKDGGTYANLYLVDDETILISEKLMKGLSKDLDDFWEGIAHLN